MENIVKDSSHTLGLISLAQAVSEINKDYWSRNENPNPINVPLITQSQFFNIMDGDGLSHSPSNFLNLTDMEIV